MKLKKPLALLTAAAIAAAMSGCGNGAENADTADNAMVQETSNTESEIQDVQTETEFQPTTAKEYSDMVQRSFVSLGNTYRLENKLSKAAQGEKITVAYLGGSITEGIGGTPDTCYAKLSYNYIAENFGTGDNVEYVNAGVSGTPSILGNLRVRKDVLDKNADIVFVEFAVNDGMDQLYKESYESLIRTILKQDNEPAVILLFTVTKTGHTCQEHMSQIGEHYGLPMISVPDAIQPEIEAGNMTWADYSNDEAHPNAEGHKLVAEFIEYYFEVLKARSAVDEPVEIPVLPKFGNPYEDAFLAEVDYDNSDQCLQIGETGSFALESRSIADFPKGAWVYSGEGAEPLKMTVTGNSFFLVCRRNNSETMGKFEVYIDGKRAATIDTNQSDGWGDPYAFQAIRWSGVHEMNVELVPIVPEGDSAGKTIEIFAVGVTANEELKF
ncbi:MAG: SGNH/GDSL hydrolase family protein [Ruminococcus sp.]|nr:SGNH/GDSL hydrolase family protein [Ruminococcus sp.]MCM1480560.1 SGNH/GDSL hydrolase family protein [Muribaculaceae bacterium]